VRKTQEGGLNCVSFFFVFSKVRTQTKNSYKQLLKWCSELKMQRIRTERKREERHKAIYTGSFHKPEVVLSPLHFQVEFTKCNIWLQVLKHNYKSLPMLKNTIKRLLMLKHTSKRLSIKQNYKKNVWHLNTWTL